jgi:PAS domain S-box-containing protein
VNGYHPEKGERWAEGHFIPTHEADGSIMWYGIFLDITERRQIEKALTEANLRYNETVRGGNIGLWDWELNSNRVHYSPEWKAQIGYGVDEISDDFEEWRSRIHYDDLSATLKALYSTLEGISKEYKAEFRFRHKDGSWRWITAHGTVLADDAGRPSRMVGSHVDVTERKQMENQILQAQKMESIGILSGGIAHDFNNILFPIMGMAEMLLEDLPSTSPEYENAQEIFKAALRASNLVKQILAFSRKTDQNKIPTRMQNILKDVLKLTRSTIPSNIDIHQDIQFDCGLILADPTQLHQIAMNLITNAYHAVEADGGRIVVRLQECQQETELSVRHNSILEAGSYLNLSVSDTGHGIQPEVIDKIFDPYFTTKETGKGTGLGLAVVLGIVQSLGGTVKTSSEVGKGTTFDVYIPLIDMTQIPETNNRSEKLPGGNERILLVDDEESVARLEKQMLERMGYRVTLYNSSIDALETFRSAPQSFDLVLTDLTMPNMTGKQFAKNLKIVRSDIPVIICTGYSDTLDQERAASIGVNGFLLKPVVKSELLKMVRKVLNES